MDLETLETYAEYGRLLSKNDEKELKRMLEDEFYAEQKDVLQGMLMRKVKIEQECVEISHNTKDFAEKIQGE